MDGIDLRNETFVDVDMYSFPPDLRVDEFYSAILEHPDHNIYMATNSILRGTHVCSFSRREKKIVDRADLSAAFGERRKGIPTQGKVHGELFLGQDNRIYSATHTSHVDFHENFDDKFPSEYSFPGGHWFAFDPPTNHVQDLGIGLPRDGIISVYLDRDRQTMYGHTYPRCMFLKLDLKTGITRNLGRISTQVSRKLIGLNDGRVFVGGKDGWYVCYDPRADTLKALPVRGRVREGFEWFKMHGQDGRFRFQRTWMCGATDPNRMKFYTLGYDDGWLVEYDGATDTAEQFQIFKRPYPWTRGFDGGYEGTASQIMVTGPDGGIYIVLITGSAPIWIWRFDPAGRKVDSLGIMRGDGVLNFTYPTAACFDREGYFYVVQRRPVDERIATTFEPYATWHVPPEPMAYEQILCATKVPLIEEHADV